jgi:phycocyanin-associated rod linker protein
MTAVAAAERLGIQALAQTTPIEYRANLSESQLNALIQAVYRQVIGNDHIFGSDRLELQSAESLLRRGSVSVREFVRVVAKSEAYKRRFFYLNSQTRAIELNFKHLLGRAPTDGKDIARHLDLYQSQGHSGEIDSYLDSRDYLEAFGDHTVPYARGFEFRRLHTTQDFTHLFALYGGYANSDRSQGSRPRLMNALATGLAPAIQQGSVLVGSPASRHLGPSTGGSDQMFCLEVTRLLNPAASLVTSNVYRRANQRLFVSGDQLSSTLQRIVKTGGKVVSVRRA